MHAFVAVGVGAFDDPKKHLHRRGRTGACSSRMILKYSVLSKSQAFAFFRAKAILQAYINIHSCLENKQPDACDICASGVSFVVNFSPICALHSTAQMAEGFKGGYPLLLFFAIL